MHFINTVARVLLVLDPEALSHLTAIVTLDEIKKPDQYPSL